MSFIVFQHLFGAFTREFWNSTAGILIIHARLKYVTCCVTCRHIITSFSSRMLDGVSSMWTLLEIKPVLVFLAGLLLSRLS